MGETRHVTERIQEAVAQQAVRKDSNANAGTPSRSLGSPQHYDSMTASKIVLVFSIAYAIYIIGWRL